MLYGALKLSGQEYVDVYASAAKRQTAEVAKAEKERAKKQQARQQQAEKEKAEQQQAEQGGQMDEGRSGA